MSCHRSHSSEPVRWEGRSCAAGSSPAPSRSPGGIRVTNRTAEKAAALAELDGVESIALSEHPDGNVEAVAGSRVVVVGVKPQMVGDLLTQLAPHLREDAIVVSIAAGVTLGTFERHLPGAAVVRSMPNTPSTAGKGVTGIAGGTHATDEDIRIVRRLFETVGDVFEVAGDDGIDAISTITGSGPAYVFLLIEEFTKAARHQGFGDEDAARLAAATFAGATALLDASGDEPAELRRRVTSPHGTTERAVEVLQAADLGGTFSAATDAAYARAKELAAGA